MDKPAIVNHGNGIRQGEYLLKFQGDEQDCPAGVPLCQYLAMDSFNSAYIQSPGGLDKNQEIRSQGQFPGDNRLLLVSSAHSSRQTFGPPAAADVLSVDAELWRARRGIENYDAAALRLQTGAGAELLYFTAHCVEEVQTGPWWELLFEKGTARCGENSRDMIVTFNDGSTKNYGSLDGKKMMLKLDKVVEAVRTGRRPLCTLETVRSHLQTVIMVQESPIEAVPAEKIAQGKNEAGDPFYSIPGFSPALIRCYRENHLPREIGYTV
jgi:hypothetical protein